MTGRLKFATPTQVLMMSLLWMAACFAIDYVYNPQLWARSIELPPSRVPLSLHFHHLRCTGCEGDIKKALATLPWLQNAPMTIRTAGDDTIAGNFAGWLDIEIQEIPQIDFIALDQALRQEGYVASNIQFGGLRHFRLEGRVRHLCTREGQQDCEPLPEIGTVRRGDRLKWLDSMTTDATAATVMFHVRFQQPNDRIDVNELFAAMDDYGMYPYTLHVVATAEK
jgi:hypothetical protein